jgi:hypothetical protein
VTDALRSTARQLGIVVAAGVAASLAFGIGLGIAQDESVVRWIAYMLYVAGAVVVGFAFFTGAPPSPRKLARQRLTKDASQEEPPKPFASELVVLVVGGIVLFAAGVLLELAV